MVIALKPSTATAITYTNCCGAFFYYDTNIWINGFFGGFSFVGFGICVANSIESKENKKIANVMTGLSVTGMLSFIIGIIGLFVVS